MESFNGISKKIKRVQFSVLSPDEIRKMSVVEVKKPDTFENGKPVVGGLFDLRMGTTENDERCLSCDLKSDKCPGHFGHIELAKPVYHIQYIKKIKQVLQCICIFCSKILIDTSELDDILLLRKGSRCQRLTRLIGSKKSCRSANGCGAIQPTFSVQEHVKLMYEFRDVESNEGKKYLPADMCLNILSRITNDDLQYFGFSQYWSRPEWFMSTVIPVPPPAVRPAVRTEVSGRQEDDITTALNVLIKWNNVVRAQANSGKSIQQSKIEQYIYLLNVYAAQIVDNDLPRLVTSIHRSGRPLNSISKRIKGKEGRMRTNLMGKRVDFCGRSVITPDPNIDIDELGVPIKVAMNLTIPEVVTKYNLKNMYRLLHNGPDKHPGAKRLTQSNNQTITLKYIDTEKIVLHPGDILERHLADGDIIIFNRQPTLHRMSMMGHRVRVMPYLTFRLNISAAKPYNADFDGDEMNLFAPQSLQTKTELKVLSMLTSLMINPKNSSPDTCLVQDGLLGSSLITYSETEISKKRFYNIITWNDYFNGNIPDSYVTRDNKPYWNGRQVFTTLLPNVNMRRYSNIADFVENYKKEDWYSKDDIRVTINNGVLETGIIDVTTVGNGQNGNIVQILWNDYGQKAAARFVNSTQQMINQWLMYRGFTIGMADCITQDSIHKTVKEHINIGIEKVYKKIEETEKGLIEAQLGKTIEEIFEEEVIGVLGETRDGAGKIAITSLYKDNNMMHMVNSGSKGKVTNVIQITACLGQQIVSGGRVQKQYGERTLPHYLKFDNSPSARGFVENSYITGLTPSEMFFHAMGGREGLSDTAVKTADGGYIARRLMKALEDVAVRYDNTVRNSVGQIIQFLYGECGINPIYFEKQKFESIQLNDTEMSKTYKFTETDLKDVLRKKVYKDVTSTKDYREILDDEYTDIYRDRQSLRKLMYHNQGSDMFMYPANIRRLVINAMEKFNIKSSSKNYLNPLDIIEQVKKVIDKVINLFGSEHTVQINQSLKLFRMLLQSSLSSKRVIIEYNLNKTALEWILNMVITRLTESIVEAGEAVGPIASQSITEPVTQMTLNTFHSAGGAKTGLTEGVPRTKEILSVTSNLKTPANYIYLRKEDMENLDIAKQKMNEIEFTLFKDVVKTIEIYFDPDYKKTIVTNDRKFIEDYYKYYLVDESKVKNLSKWVIRFVLNKNNLIHKQLRLNVIKERLEEEFKNCNCVASDDNAKELVIRVRIDFTKQDRKFEENKIMENKKDEMLDMRLKGIDNISAVKIFNKQRVNTDTETGELKTLKEYFLITYGNNLQQLLTNYDIDAKKTGSNNIVEIYNTLGVEAARNAIVNELKAVIFGTSKVNHQHICLLADVMTNRGILMSIDRHGINKADHGPLSRSTFEQTVDQFVDASMYAESDDIDSVSSNIVFGQQIPVGTGSCDIILDEEAFAIGANDINNALDQLIL